MGTISAEDFVKWAILCKWRVSTKSRVEIRKKVEELNEKNLISKDLFQAFQRATRRNEQQDDMNEAAREYD